MPGSITRRAAHFRLAVTGIITIWLAIDLGAASPVTLAMLGYTGFAALGLLATRPRLLRLFKLGMLIDIAAVTLTIYAFGTTTTPMVMLYVPLVVVVSLQGGRRQALLSLLLALVGLSTVLLLEQLHWIRAAPLAGLLPSTDGSPIGPAFAIFLTIVALGSAFMLIDVHLRRSELQTEAVHLLQASAQKDRARYNDLRAQLEEVQRLESLGRLAGGVAHDFNNLLTGILGYARLLKEDIPQNDAKQEDLNEVIKAAGRASELTSQLLAFSRKQLIQVRNIDLNLVLGDLGRLLERIIGENVDIHFAPGPSPASIKADPAQVEQIVVNLAVNARDAMPGGGQLTIETMPVVLDEEYCRTHIGVAPGLYVMLAISDSGQGMDEETRARVFEPFYTTKERGKGTGLGLATVYGIIKQHDGHIDVESEPGAGSTFRVYFPLAEGELDEAELFVETTPSGRETILLAEDEEVVRRLATRILSRFGYQVIAAASGEEALDAAADYTGRIHLLLTDLVMPGMSGKVLAERLARQRADLRVLYMSGYPADELGRHGLLALDIAFMAKPFSAEDLLSKVRQVLDQLEMQSSAAS